MQGDLEVQDAILRCCHEGDLVALRHWSDDQFLETLRCVVDKDGSSPIVCAARRGHVEIVNFLRYHPAYHYVYRTEKRLVVDLLAEAGCHPITSASFWGDDASMYEYAIKRGDVKMLCRLVEAYGFDPCAGHQRGRSFLFLAAKGKHLDMMRFLLHLGLTASCLNRDRWTVGMALVYEPVELNAGGQVIHRAPLQDRELARVLEDLLDEGMHISPVDYTGNLKICLLKFATEKSTYLFITQSDESPQDRSLLLHCMAQGYFHCVEILLQRGADIHVRDEFLCNVAYYLFVSAARQSDARYASEDHVCALLTLFLAGDIDINVHRCEKFGASSTTLMEAVRTGYFEAARLLLQAGAQVAPRDQRNMNVGFCLFLSSSRRHHPAPSTSEEQTAVGADGDVSGEQAHLAMLNDLLQAGLDPCVRDKQNNRASDWAKRNGFEQCAARLLAAESDAINHKDSSHINGSDTRYPSTIGDEEKSHSSDVIFDVSAPTARNHRWSSMMAYLFTKRK